MKVKDFISALNVSRASYYRFMRQRGKNKGIGSDTFLNALLFFRGGEELGILRPERMDSGGKAPIRSATKSTSRPAVLQLSGELDDAVEVYDSCDEVRRKIKNHLRRRGANEAQLLRDLYAQFHGPRMPKALQSAQLNKFCGQKGAMTGNMSGIYYAAYVLFEKERITMRRPKSRHRLAMEDAWYMQGGVDVKTNLNSAVYICASDSEIFMNSVGQVRSLRVR
jgi:hypothetical protein